MPGYTYTGKLSNDFICDKRLEAYDFRVFLVLMKWNTYNKGKSISCMADEIKLSSKSFSRSLKRLEEYKYIKIERKTNWDTNKYHILNKARRTDVPHEGTVSPIEGTEVPLNEGTVSPPYNITSNITKEKEKESIPYKEIIEYLNKISNKGFSCKSGKSQTLIKARWNEGHKLKDFIYVIDVYHARYKGTDFYQHMKPSTLFNGKFNERTQWEMPKQKKSHYKELK